MSVLVYEMMFSSNNRSASIKGLYGLKKQQTKRHAFLQLSMFQHFIKIYMPNATSLAKGLHIVC